MTASSARVEACSSSRVMASISRNSSVHFIISFCTGPPASRCDISMKPIPVPPMFSSSLCTSLSTGVGNVPGPAEKLCARKFRSEAARS